MWIDGKMEVDSFTVVRQLLEKNYLCMGVTCSQVLKCWGFDRAVLILCRMVLYGCLN